MLHWRVIPLIMLGLLSVWAFYLLIRNQGEGVRTEGRTLVDEPDEHVPGQSE